MNPPSPVDIHFVRGDDGLMRPPRVVAQAGLTRRFAVVQQTSVPEWPDMWFEEPLWRALTEFVTAESGSERFTVYGQPGSRRTDQIALSDYLNEWDGLSLEERDPPGVLAWRGEAPIMALAPEYWCSVGGPQRYHDSYTYGLWGEREFGDQVVAWLAARPEAVRWRLSLEVLEPDPALRRGPFRRLLARMLG